MPTLTTVLPAYNGSRYIAAAIDSVLRQTDRSWELIVVDDGSTDDTAAVVQSFGDRYPDRIRYQWQANQGVGAARNQGVRLARSAWIAFLDQDDYFLPDKFALQLALAQAQPQLGIINSGWQIVAAEGQPLAAVQPWQQGLDRLTPEAWVRWKPVFLGAMLFQKAWLERIGGFDPQWQQTGDVELVLRLAAAGCPAAWVQQITVAYRQHSQNVSRDMTFQARELEAMLDRFFAETQLSAALRRCEADSRYQSLVWSAWRFQFNGDRSQMAQYLKKSLPHWNGTKVGVVLDWMAQFKTYTAEYGREFDLTALTQSLEWQELMRACQLPV